MFPILLTLLITFINAQYQCLKDPCIALNQAECSTVEECTYSTSLNKCVCNSLVPMDIVIAMDSSGSMLNSGWNQSITFVNQLIESAISPLSNIGIIKWSVDNFIVWNLNDNQFDRKLIQNKLKKESWLMGFTYMKNAVLRSIELFEQQSTNFNKLFVLMTDGAPVPAFDQSPCDKLPSRLRAAGVKVIIIGVGIGWNPKIVRCLVDFDDSQIIEVSEFSQKAFDNVRNQTDPYLCNCNLDIIPSEIKPTKGDNTNQHPVEFIELYNKGAKVDLCTEQLMLNGLFIGDIIKSNVKHYPNNINTCIFEPNTYYTLYNNNILNPYCFNCSCSLNINNNEWCLESFYNNCNNNKCLSINHNSVTNWNLHLSHNIKGSLWNLQYNITGGNEWIKITNGYTYQLHPLSCWGGASSGRCWQESCTFFGTPGWSPLETCDCTLVGDIHKCQKNGDTQAKLTNNRCQCSTHFYPNPTQCECVYLAQPTYCNISITTKNNIANAKFEIEPKKLFNPMYDVYYILEFTLGDGSRQIIKTAVETGQIDNSLWKNHEYQVTVIINIIDPNTKKFISQHKSVKNNCTKVTPMPTPSPTRSPTRALPKIKSCNVTILSKMDEEYSRMRVEWSKANTSVVESYTDDEFDDNYMLFSKFKSSVMPVEDRYVTNGFDYERNKIKIYREIKPNEFKNNVIVSISAIVHEIYKPNNEYTDILRGQMINQATLCVYRTMSPTKSPTNIPSLMPSNIPTNTPTYKPTQSPTFAKHEIEYCQVILSAKVFDRWTLEWKMINNSQTPNNYNLIAKIENKNAYIITSSMKSPLPRSGISISLNTDFKLFVSQILYTGGSFQELPPGKKCKILTQSPTLTPTLSYSPTISTLLPTNVPSKDPTKIPTISPTFNLKIEYCNIEILNSNKFIAYFKIPNYVEQSPETPNKHEIRYNIMYGRYSTTIWVDHNEYKNGTIFFIKKTAVGNIDITSKFKMNIINNKDSSIIYTYENTNCDVKTNNPTINPTKYPSLNPSTNPTKKLPGVFIRTKNTRLCNNVDRCECNKDFMNYFCESTHDPPLSEQNTIEFQYNEAPLDIIDIAKIPYGSTQSVKVFWELTPLNNGNKNKQNNLLKKYVTPTSKYITINDDTTTISITFKEPVNEIITSNYYLTLINCTIIDNPTQKCSIIYPKRIILEIQPIQAGQNALIYGTDEPPDWIWVLLAGGIFGFASIGFILYTFKKNTMMQQESNIQNFENNLIVDQTGIHDVNNDLLNINPLA